VHSLFLQAGRRSEQGGDMEFVGGFELGRLGPSLEYAARDRLCPRPSRTPAEGGL
jgi:hypothetical protein